MAGGRGPTERVEPQHACRPDGVQPRDRQGRLRRERRASTTAPAATHVVADVVGYFAASAASRFVPLSPGRVLDTRIGLGAPGALVGTAGINVVIRRRRACPPRRRPVDVERDGRRARRPPGWVTIWPSGGPHHRHRQLELRRRPDGRQRVLAKLGTDGRCSSPPSAADPPHRRRRRLLHLTRAGPRSISSAPWSNPDASRSLAPAGDARRSRLLAIKLRRSCVTTSGWPTTVARWARPPLRRRCRAAARRRRLGARRRARRAQPRPGDGVDPPAGHGRMQLLAEDATGMLARRAALFADPARPCGTSKGARCSPPSPRRTSRLRPCPPTTSRCGR